MTVSTWLNGKAITVFPLYEDKIKGYAHILDFSDVGISGNWEKIIGKPDALDLNF